MIEKDMTGRKFLRTYQRELKHMIKNNKNLKKQNSKQVKKDTYLSKLKTKLVRLKKND